MPADPKSRGKKPRMASAKQKATKKPKAAPKAEKTKAPAKSAKRTKKPAAAPKKATRPQTAGGRPSEYRPEYAEQAARLCRAGMTDGEVAEFFGKHRTTIYRWCAMHPEFGDAMQLGGDLPDSRVERALYHRANGYDWLEQQAFKVKDVKWVKGQKTERERVEIVEVRRAVPPDTSAAMFWLKNRRPDNWRDRQEHTGKDGVPLIPVLNVTYAGVD